MTFLILTIIVNGDKRLNSISKIIKAKPAQRYAQKVIQHLNREEEEAEEYK